MAARSVGLGQTCDISLVHGMIKVLRSERVGGLLRMSRRVRPAGLGLFLLGALIWGQPAAAAPLDEFRVSQLPGLAAAPPFEQFAGYLPVDKAGQDKMFFWLVGSQSKPSTDPLVIWLSGGPGCSSIAAMFEENGPLTLSHNGTVSITNHGWNQRANVLYVDQPLQTGLSFSGDDHFVFNQYEITQNFVAFLKNFYNAFPQYRGRPLYLTGESYAGHFIPAIATELLKEEGSSGDIRLAGLAIGNGWVDPQTHIQLAPDVAKAAGVISAERLAQAKTLFATAIRNGGNPPSTPLNAPSSYRPDTVDATGMMDPFTTITLPPALATNPQAKAFKALFDRYTGRVLAVDFTNPDFIALIDILAAGPPGLRDLLPPVIKIQFAGRSTQELIFEYLIARVVSYTGDKMGDAVNLMDLENYGPVSMIGTPTAWPGGDDAFNSYMIRPDVLKALHAEQFGKRFFGACNPLTYLYLSNDYYKSALYMIPAILKRVPVLFYNGQDDLIASAASTQHFLDKMAADPKTVSWPGKDQFMKAPYMPWNFAGQRAGYFQSAGNLQFLVVLKASHMVPLSVPLAAQEMIGRFVHGEAIVPPASH